MAPVGKKPRHSIGPMLDTVVPETENQNNTNVDSDLDESFSDNNSRNPDDSGNDSGNDQTLNSDDDDANNQEIVKIGHAKMGFEWGIGKVMILELDSENNVIGSNAALFSSQLGIMAKDGNKLPLSYTDWRAVPNTKKDLIWVEVKENTNLVDNYKKNCLKKLGKLWKDWKNRLKAKYYTPYRHDKSYILSKCPQRVEADQWPKLVNHWSSNNAKKLSKTNRNSRKHVKLPSRMGRKDMASAKEEYRREYDKEPSKVDLFIYSRQRKDRKPIDHHTEEKIARLKELRQKLPEDLLDDIDANDAIFEEVIGSEAPRCLCISSAGSKSKNVIFTSREEFDRAIQEKSNEKVGSIQKDFEEQISKLKDEYCSHMEMLQARLLKLENQNIIASGSSNSRRIQAFNNGSSSEGFMNFENTNEASGTLEMRKEINNSDKNNTNIHGDATCPQEQGKTTRRTSKRKEKC